MTANPEASPKPRWYQFRVAALLGLTLLIAILLAVWTNWRTWLRMQQAAIEGQWSLVSVNGETEYANEFQLKIDGRELAIKAVGGKWTKGRIEIDVTKDPPWMDVVDAQGNRRTAIYRRSGETITMLLPGPARSGHRPLTIHESRKPSRSGRMPRKPKFLPKRHPAVGEDPLFK